MGKPLSTVADFKAFLGNPANCRTLAYYPGDGFAFAAFDISGSRRSLVAIGEVVVAYDLRTVQVNGASFAPADGGIDLAGVIIGDWAVFFHNEPFMARSGLSFVVERDREIKLLVTGLAPGRWELWRNGWLDWPSIAVKPEHGAAFLTTPGGRFFLRRF